MYKSPETVSSGIRLFGLRIALNSENNQVDDRAWSEAVAYRRHIQFLALTSPPKM